MKKQPWMKLEMKGRNPFFYTKSSGPEQSKLQEFRRKNSLLHFGFRNVNKD